MKRPKNKREHRVGGGIKPDVMDSALLGLESRVKFHQSELTEEKNPTLEVTAAKEKVKEAYAAYKDHPCDAMHKALNDAHADLRRAITAEFNSMDPSKAFQKAKQKAMSLRAKADDIMKAIRNTKLERNDAQMRADGMAVMRVDKKRAKLEAQFATTVDEMRFYQSMMGGVYKNNDFSEDEHPFDFGACQRADGSVYGTSGTCRKGRPISLGPQEGMPIAYKKAIERGVSRREANRIANEIRAELGVKQIKQGRGLSEAQRRLGEAVQLKKQKPLPLNDAKTVGKAADANEKRKVKQEDAKRAGNIQEQVAAAKAKGRAQAKEDIAKREAKGAAPGKVSPSSIDSRNARAAALAANAPKVIKRSEGGIHDIMVNGEAVGRMQKLPGDPRYQIQVGSKQERVAGLGAARARARAMAQEIAAAKPKGAGEVRAENQGGTDAQRRELRGLLRERDALLQRGARASDQNELQAIMKRGMDLENQIESLNVRLNPELKQAYAVRRAADKAWKEAQGRLDNKAKDAANKDRAFANEQIKAAQDKILAGKTKAAGKPDSLYGGWETTLLKKQLGYANEKQRLRIMEELNRRGEEGYTKNIAAAKPKEEKEVKGSGFPKVSGIKGYDPIEDFNAQGNKPLGSGAMGEVKETKGPPPGIVKKGAIGENEAKALKVLEGTGIAPTLHGQKITGKAEEVEYGLGAHVREAQGYLAMSKAPGEPLGSQAAVFSPWRSEGKRQLEEMTDAYISARATIHRAGVAHNDMHSGNFFYDQNTGKGTLVDFGLSQVDSRAALMEGLGLGTGGKGSGRSDSFGSNEGDWQAARIKNQLKVASTQSGKFALYMENRARVLEAMKRAHPDAHMEYKNGGIRVDSSILDDSGLTTKEAQTYINMLYEGID